MLKCHSSYKLNLFNKRFVFADGPESGGSEEPTAAVLADAARRPYVQPGAPARADVPRPATSEAPQAPHQPLAKPEVNMELTDAKFDQMLPEQADLNQPLAEDTLGKVIDSIDAKAKEQVKMLIDYGLKPGADQPWARDAVTKLLEASGAAKQRYRDRWERYKADLETKRQAALQSVVDDLWSAAASHAETMKAQVAVTGENYAQFKEHNADWLKEHEAPIMEKVYAMGEAYYESGALRELNKYDSEVGDNRLSKYQEDRYFDDLEGPTGWSDEDMTQYVQGMATALLAYGPKAEENFAKACQKQEKEAVGALTDAALYKHDAEDAALEALEGGDKEKAAKVMSELRLPYYSKEGFAHAKETQGFLYASLLVAQKELDGDLYEKYVTYLKTKINDRPKDQHGRLADFDYRQFMNPTTFKDAYLKTISDEAKKEALDQVKFNEQNNTFLADVKGKVTAAEDLWVKGSAAIAGASRTDLPQIREIEELKSLVASIETNPHILANVDLSTHQSSMQLAAQADQLQGKVTTQLETQFNAKREAMKEEMKKQPGFETVAAMENTPDHPALKAINADPAKKYIFDNFVNAWSQVANAKFEATSVVEVEALMAKMYNAVDSSNKALAALGPVLSTPEGSNLKQYTASRRGVELRDFMDALGITEKNAKYYSAFKSLEEGDGNVKILAQDENGKWNPILFRKGENIFAQMKAMGLKGTQIAIDTRGIDQAVTKYGSDWENMRKRYRSDYARAFAAPKPTVVVKEEAPAAAPARADNTTDQPKTIDIPEGSGSMIA